MIKTPRIHRRCSVCIWLRLFADAHTVSSPQWHSHGIGAAGQPLHKTSTSYRISVTATPVPDCSRPLRHCSPCFGCSSHPVCLYTGWY